MANNRVSRPAPGNSFTKPDAKPEFDPTRPGAFDISGFLAGAKKHTNVRVIPVTYKPEIAAELERLTTEADKIRRVQAEPEDSPRRRVSQKSGKAALLEKLEERIAELEPELDGTWLEVKVRGITPAEQDEARKAGHAPGVAQAAAIFEKTCLVRDPDMVEDGDDDGGWAPMPHDAWLELIEAIGPAQYVMIDKAHEGLAYQAVTPDFYERFSASRATRSTSAS